MSELDATSASSRGLPDEQIRLHVEPYEAETQAQQRVHADLVSHQAVRAHLGGANLQLAEFELLDKDAAEQARFEAVVFDPDDRRCVRVQGTLSDIDQARASLVARRQRPTDAEFQQAVEH